MKPSVEKVQKGGRTVYVLRDESSGAEASVLPEYGFNLFDLKLPVAGKVRPVLFAAGDFAENLGSAARNGIPILFPFPNRIRDGKYTFEGKTYELPKNLGPNAIHGFALDAAWDVVAFEATDKGAVIEGRYQLSRQSPKARDLWPTDAVLQVRYELAGRKLDMHITVSNPSARPLPFGFGIHPYFYLPFEPEGDAARTEVILPASKVWTLEEFLPTGKVEDVPEPLDFRKGKPRKGLKLDDVFAGLSREGDAYRCVLRDLVLKSELIVTFGENFRELVAYTPPDLPNVISLEPYTQTTDAINLQAKGIDAGLRIIDHDHQDHFHIAFETNDL